MCKGCPSRGFCIPDECSRFGGTYVPSKEGELSEAESSNSPNKGSNGNKE